MKYMINERTGDKISVLGFGSSYIAERDQSELIPAALCQRIPADFGLLQLT